MMRLSVIFDGVMAHDVTEFIVKGMYDNLINICNTAKAQLSKY
jgi:hypothetical protein